MSMRVVPVQFNPIPGHFSDDLLITPGAVIANAMLLAGVGSTDTEFGGYFDPSVELYCVNFGVSFDGVIVPPAAFGVEIETSKGNPTLFRASVPGKAHGFFSVSHIPQPLPEQVSRHYGWKADVPVDLLPQKPPFRFVIAYLSEEFRSQVSLGQQYRPMIMLEAMAQAAEMYFFSRKDTPFPDGGPGLIPVFTHATGNLLWAYPERLLAEVDNLFPLNGGPLVAGHVGSVLVRCLDKGNAQVGWAELGFRLLKKATAKKLYRRQMRQAGQTIPDLVSS